MGKPRKPRSDAKIYQLPKSVLDGVNERLVNYNMSYADIIAWLAEQGYSHTPFCPALTASVASRMRSVAGA